MTVRGAALAIAIATGGCPRGPVDPQPLDAEVLARGRCQFETGVIGARPYIAFGSGGLAGAPESGTTRTLAWATGARIPLAAVLPVDGAGMLPGTTRLLGEWPGSTWLFLRRATGKGHQIVTTEQRRIFFRAGDSWEDLGIDVGADPGIVAASKDTLAVIDDEKISLYKKSALYAPLAYPSAECPDGTAPRPVTARGHGDAIAIVIACASHPGSKFIRRDDALRLVVLLPDLATRVLKLPSAGRTFLLSDGTTLALLSSNAASALTFVTSDWNLQPTQLTTSHAFRSAALVAGTLYALTDDRQLFESHGTAFRELRLPKGFIADEIDDAAMITGRMDDGERAIVARKHTGQPRVCRVGANGAATLD